MAKQKFSPFEKVLVRTMDDGIWCCRFYDHWDGEEYYHLTTDGTFYYDENIIPYEGNEHLAGQESVEKEIKLEKGEYLLCNNDLELLQTGIGFMTTLSHTYDKYFYTGKETLCADDWLYAIRFSDINVSNIEENKKNVLIVKNGKVIREYQASKHNN